MLHFNTPEGSEERQKTEALTLQEEMDCIDILNELIESKPEGTSKTDDEDLLQKFVNHYQNLCHYKATTDGLWATDQPDKFGDKFNLLFRISFK